MRRAWLGALAVALVASGCAGIQLGREFPSPDAAQIRVNVTMQAVTIIWHLPGQSAVPIQAQAAAQPFTAVATGQAP